MAIYTAIVNPEDNMNSKQLARVQGCYLSEDNFIFEIDGKKIILESGSAEFKGLHEKDRDILLVDRPVQFNDLSKKLEFIGDFTKVPVSYTNPLQLMVFTQLGQERQMTQVECSGTTRPGLR